MAATWVRLCDRHREDVLYRQIRVHPDDRGLQRILWQESISEGIKEYWLNTVTYGLSCAPYLALRTLRQLADDEGFQFPQGTAVFRSDVYIDDILTGPLSCRKL